MWITESCQDLVINLPDKVTTNMLEIWKSTNVQIKV